jgi:hypothetical protein
MFAIWNEFSKETREVVAAREYKTPVELDVIDQWVYPRCAAGKCPLGVAITFEKGIKSTEPDAGAVASKLGYTAGSQEELDIAYAALEFIRAWEQGRVTNIREALGI